MNMMDFFLYKLLIKTWGGGRGDTKIDIHDSFLPEQLRKTYFLQPFEKNNRSMIHNILLGNYQ